MGGSNGRGINKAGSTSSAPKANVTIKGTPSISMDEINKIVSDVGVEGDIVINFTNKFSMSASGSAYLDGGQYVPIGGGLYADRGGIPTVLINDTYNLKTGEKGNQKHVLAHELTHLKQYSSGRLEMIYRVKKVRGKNKLEFDSINWEGKKYISASDYSSIKSMGSLSKAGLGKYKSLPWEAEAYSAGDKYGEI